MLNKTVQQLWVLVLAPMRLYIPRAVLKQAWAKKNKRKK